MYRLDPYDRDDMAFANATFAHMTAARRIAVELSREYGERVAIVRMGDSERTVLVVLPDGSFSAPAQVKDPCTRLSEPSLPCWCPACRAIRKAQR